MTETTKPGFPCWTDLSVTDMDGAKAFYTELFGWTYGETREELGGYTQAFKNGKAVAGLYHLMPGMTVPVWTLYFATDDIAKTERAVADNGGRVIAPAMAVMDMGSMVLGADPTGAVFGAWQPGTFAGAQLFNEPGSVAWEDLRSNDPETSRSFFSSLFGYRHDELPVPSPMDYKTFAFADSDRPLGGMGEMFGAPAGTPSHWLIYFNVEDTPTALETVKANGGSVIVDSMQTPFGRQAMVTDPFGGTFNIIDPFTG